MTTQCSHEKFTWFDDESQNLESGYPELAKNKSRLGHWMCLSCSSMIESPIGSGICDACHQPIDDHRLMMYSYPQCVRK